MTSNIKEFIFVVNPYSAGGKNYRKIKKIIQLFENFNFSLEIIEAKNAEHVKIIIKNYYHLGKRNFLVAGGGGSLFHVINAIMEQYKEGDSPILGIIPSGTGNALYSSIAQYEENFELRIQQAISNIIRGETKNLDVFKVECKDNKVYYFVNMFVTGFFADLIEIRNKYFSRLGSLGYDILCLYKAVLSKSSNGENFYLKIDNKKISYENGYMTGIFNSKYFGNNLNTSPLSFVNDGFGEVVVWKNIGKIPLIKNLFKIKFMGGGYLLSENTSCYKFKELEFLSNKKEENIIIDGEIVSILPKKIVIIPSAIKVFF